MSQSNGCCGCSGGSSSFGVFTAGTMVEMSKEYQNVELMALRDALDCLDLAKEYAKEVLLDHDANLGRTTIKNKRLAEGVEKDIRFIEATIEKMDKANVGK
jgi:hypothetical protein